MKQRSIPVAIILSIVTCGIYGLYWFVCITNEMNALSNQNGAPSGGLSLVLSIITCNIYGIYWAYKMGEKVDVAKQQRGIPSSNSGILYLILQLFGLSVIGMALMQNEANNMIAMG